MLKVQILRSAEHDIEKAFSFYEKKACGLGKYFLDSIYADIDSLVFFAGVHQKVFGWHRLIARRFPFAVYYKIVGSTVIVYAVLDCRGRPSLIQMRLLKESENESNKEQ